MADRKLFLNSGNSKPDYPKATHDYSFTNHLSARFGRVIPAFVKEIPPDSYLKINPNMAFDFMPMTFPLQSRVTAHLSFYKVPLRILWDNFDDFLVGVGNHVFPFVDRSDNFASTGSLGDYLNIPSTFIASDDVYKYLAGKDTFFVSSNVDSFLIPAFRQGSSLADRPFDMDSIKYPYPSSSPYRHFLISDVIKSMPNTSTLNTNFYQHFLSTSNLSRTQITSSVFGFIISNSNVEDNGQRQYYLEYIYRSNSSPAAANFSSTTVTIDGTTYYDHRIIFNPLNSIFLNDTNVANTFNMINSLIADKYEVRFFCLLQSSSIIPGLMRLPFKMSSGSLVGDSTAPETSPKSNIHTYQFFEGSHYVAYVARDYAPRPKDDSPFLRHQTTQAKKPLTSLPFRAYEFIWNYYFRNRAIDPFFINDVQQANNFITNHNDGGDSTTPVDFKLAPYEFDYFTTCLTNPQLGDAPLIGVTSNEETFNAQMRLVPKLDSGEYDYANAYNVGVEYAANGNIVGISNYDEVANKTSVQRLSELIRIGISINDIRNVSAYQRYLEKMQLTNQQYERFSEEFYGVTPPTGENFPVYCGGIDRVVSIGKLQSMAETQVGDKINSLGSFCGVGQLRMADGDNPYIKCYCHEWSYVIGLLWFSVTPVYSQVLPKFWTRRVKEDFFLPLYNNLPPQPVLKSEIAPLQCTDEQLTEVFGYQRPWYEYIMSLDEAHGAFRETMKDYLLQRQFLTPPSLMDKFIYIDPADLTNVFSYQVDDDKIFGAISYNIDFTNEVAKHSNPKIIV